jgi:hypothetical protein
VLLHGRIRRDARILDRQTLNFLSCIVTEEIEAGKLECKTGRGLARSLGTYEAWRPKLASGWYCWVIMRYVKLFI